MDENPAIPDPECTVPRAIQALADDLVPLFYDDLRRLAHRERGRLPPSATIQTTALVNEAYLKLRGARGWNDDTHFLRAASLAMRHILVDHAVARRAEKRGAGAPHLTLGAAENQPPQADGALDGDCLVEVNEALERLALQAPRLAQVVECRYFGGYDDETTARALGLSVRTVRRDWAMARAWLHRELGTGA